MGLDLVKTGRPSTISRDDLAWCYELIKSCGYSYKQAARMAGCEWQTLKRAIWRAENLGLPAIDRH